MAFEKPLVEKIGTMRIEFKQPMVGAESVDLKGSLVWIGGHGLDLGLNVFIDPFWGW